MPAQLAASGWFPDDAPISRDNLERLIAAYVEVAVRLLQAGPVMGADSHFDVLATHRLPGLARRLDGGFAEAERVLDTVEAHAPVPAAFRLLRARRYLSLADATEEHRDWYLTRAREVLTSALDDGPLEHSRRSQAALAQQKLALVSWDPDFGSYAPGTRRDNTPYDAPSSIEEDGMQLPRFIDEVERMEWALDQEGGTSAERAHWYLARDRYEDAIETLAITTSAEMASDLRAWADYLLHRARLFRALDAADVERPEVNRPGALADLRELASAPWDPAVSVARMAQATELLRRGEPSA